MGHATVVLYKPVKTTSNYHCGIMQSTIEAVERAIDRERPYRATKQNKVFLPHDNVRPRVTLTTQETFMELQWQVLSHQAHSPDITPSDVHLSRFKQHSLSGMRSRNVEEVQRFIDYFIHSKSTNFLV